MSQENAELVRRVIASANAGGGESLFRDVAPNYELDWSRTRGPEVPAVYRGEEAQRMLIDFSRAGSPYGSSRTSSSS